MDGSRFGVKLEETMSTRLDNHATDSGVDTGRQLNILGDDCARTILVETSDGPQTAKELTARTDCSSATVYRRLNDLIDSGLLTECIRFEENGSHTTAYETTIDSIMVSIESTGIDVALEKQPE